MLSEKIIFRLAGETEKKIRELAINSKYDKYEYWKLIGKREAYLQILGMNYETFLDKIER